MLKTSLIALVLMFSVGAHAVAYKVDTAKSTVYWKGTKKIGSFHDGNIAIKEGTLHTDTNGIPVSATVVIDMTKITNLDLAADPEMQKKLVGHLSSDDFFNVAKYPTAKFQSTSVTKQDDGYLVKGDLTIREKTNPIEFVAKITAATTQVTAEAKLKIDRTRWDVKYGSGNFFKELTADKIINNEIEFELKLVATK